MKYHTPTECCGYAARAENPYPVMWNPFNQVVQCHNCGQVYAPSSMEDEIKSLKASIDTYKEAWVAEQKTSYQLRESLANIAESVGVARQDSWPFHVEEKVIGMVNRSQYWMKRSLQAEDLIESIRVWHETERPMDRLMMIQSNIAKFRNVYKREDTSDFCGDLMPVYPDDSWISIKDRRPSCATPQVEILFSNGEIAESAFWVGYYCHDFQRFCVEREGVEVTHWRPKKQEDSP